MQRSHGERIYSSNPTLPPGEQGGTLRVFDIDSQNEMIRAPLGENPPMLRFSEDNAFVEFATGRRQIRIERVPLRTVDLIESSCARVSRNLTPEEWSRYLGDSAYRLTCPVLNPAAAKIQ